MATSEGELFVSERFGSKSVKRVASAQRAVSMSQPGSSRCRQRSAYLAQLHRKISNQRRNAAHQLSRRLVNNYEFIAVEDLEISKMVSGPGFNLEPRASHYVRAIAKSRLNRSIYDAGWGILLSMLLTRLKVPVGWSWQWTLTIRVKGVPYVVTFRLVIASTKRCSGVSRAVMKTTRTSTPRATFFGPVEPSSLRPAEVELRPLPYTPWRTQLREISLFLDSCSLRFGWSSGIKPWASPARRDLGAEISKAHSQPARRNEKSSFLVHCRECCRRA